MDTMEAMEGQGKGGTKLVRLHPFVSEDAARRVKVACATRGITQGELIEEFILGNLPLVPGAEAAR